MATERFSKRAMLNELGERIDALQKQYDFDPGNGWAQVEGRAIEAIFAYGQYDALCDLFDHYR